MIHPWRRTSSIIMWSFFLQRLNDDVQSRCGRWRLSFSSHRFALFCPLFCWSRRRVRSAAQIVATSWYRFQFRNQSDDVHFTRRRRRRRRSFFFFSFVGRFESWRVGLLWLAGSRSGSGASSGQHQGRAS